MTARNSTKTINQTGHKKQAAQESGEHNREYIERRAFELYEEHGRQPGHELEDWLQAEREVFEHEEAGKIG